ncbi:cytochrome P450 6A1 [Lentithecium fluviatile CBS 122367]|uniref:Cytochrome P450 6A1 n=1 Tax=Lentithecium fluviatile CBS 122367 TaxID=1168545 RepID=A0A6G1IGZ4_9PLEO|nr:cytochrome P450 6A1 [Lentithecium fluviatile CBS 122367]
MSTLLVTTTSLAALIIYVLVHTLYIRKGLHKTPQFVRGNYPILGAVGFWTRRWDFFKEARSFSKSGNFSFHAGSNLLVCVTGEKGRRVFYDSRELRLEEGYSVLFGQIPDTKLNDDADLREDARSTHQRFMRHLQHFIKIDYIRSRFPLMRAEVRAGMEAIKNDPRGVTDPFDSIYRLIFMLLIHLAGGDEMAKDHNIADEILYYFAMLDESAGATTVMFPRTPSWPFLKRTYAGFRLYTVVDNIVKQRSKQRLDDPIQYLLDEGERSYKIVEFLIGILFAGLLNSGINAAYTMCCLASSPEWLAKARQEVRLVAGKYAKDPNGPLYRQLDDVPFNAFETDFPAVGACLKDSIRLNQMMAQFRRNCSRHAIKLGNGEVIPPGAFATYHVGDAHMDPDIYPEPEKWDPSRWSPGVEQDKKGYAFVGWGCGKHPCMGMRFAKLEQNLITAYFLAYFDFHLEDEHGSKLAEPPEIDYNQHGPGRPKTKHFLKVTPLEK